jgi:hypothetical protein
MSRKTVVFSMVGGVEWVVEVVWTPLRGERLKWWVVMSKEQSKAAETRVEKKRGMRGREREGTIARISSPWTLMFGKIMRVIKIARMTKTEDRKSDDSVNCLLQKRRSKVWSPFELWETGKDDIRASR